MTINNSYSKAKKTIGLVDPVFPFEQMIIPVIEGGLLPPDIGRIKLLDLASDISATIPKTGGMKNSDSIFLTVDGIQIGVGYDLKDVNLTDPQIVEFELFFKPADFPPDGTDGPVVLEFEVNDSDSGDGQPSAFPITVRIDKLAPGGEKLPPVYLTPEQAAGGITVGDIVNGVLPLLIDPYFDSEVGDIVEMWVSDRRDPSSASYLSPKFTVSDPNIRLNVSIAEAALNDLGDGTLYFGYRVTDWAGNISKLSDLLEAQVFLSLPTLAAPLVPENDDGLITYNDATNDTEDGVVGSVGVAIPHYEGAAAGDSLYVVWGGQTLPPYKINAIEAAANPIVTIAVPYSTVQMVGSGSDIEVAFWLQRAGAPRTDSPPTRVKVDLTVPGGPITDPDPENPGVNPNINAPTIKCRTSPENTISVDDYGYDATATIPRVGVDLAPIWVVGDVIQLTWGTITAPTLPAVTVTATNQGANILIPVPFAGVIAAVGVGDIDVYFTLTRILVPGTTPVTVDIESPRQTVNVQSADTLPGNGATLPAGKFPDATERNIIIRAIGMAGTYFRVALTGVSNIAIGDEPTFSYNFVGITSGDEAAPPVGANPIEASRLKVDDVPITPAMLTAGYIDIDLPYTLTYNICRNGATLDYSLANKYGRTSATQQFVRFALNLGGGTCTIPL